MKERCLILIPESKGSPFNTQERLRLATQLRTQSGFTGASMVSIMTFGKFIAAIIQNYTLLETSMGAVTRLKTFSESTPVQDFPGEHTAPPSSWPDRGVIEMQDVTASYA